MFHHKLHHRAYGDDADHGADADDAAEEIAADKVAGIHQHPDKSKGLFRAVGNGKVQRIVWSHAYSRGFKQWKTYGNDHAGQGKFQCNNRYGRLFW